MPKTKENGSSIKDKAKPTKKKMGRPEKIIDKKTFEGLCGICCTEREICAVLDVCEDTLVTWCKKNYKDETGKGMTFSEVYATKKAIGRASLRRVQMEHARKSPAMAIFLGKNLLGQRDFTDVNVHQENNLLDGMPPEKVEQFAENLQRILDMMDEKE